MRTLRILTLAGACAVAASGTGMALEVDPEVLPEVNIGGRGVVTANYRDRDLASGGNDNGGELDVEDSSLLLGFSKFLFNDVDYGFATIGIKAPDDDTDLRDDIFLHELHVGIGARVSELLLGR
ncbi:MAG: hypothetical protein O7A65_06800, partial [Proteobacteria bacterium]|nr:hypothetical protein [Pseudomonadota bacterium]